MILFIKIKFNVCHSSQLLLFVCFSHKSVAACLFLVHRKDNAFYKIDVSMLLKNRKFEVKIPTFGYILVVGYFLFISKGGRLTLFCSLYKEKVVFLQKSKIISIRYDTINDRLW